MDMDADLNLLEADAAGGKGYEIKDRERKRVREV